MGDLNISRHDDEGGSDEEFAGNIMVVDGIAGKVSWVLQDAGFDLVPKEYPFPSLDKREGMCYAVFIYKKSSSVWLFQDSEGRSRLQLIYSKQANTATMVKNAEAYLRKITSVLRKAGLKMIQTEEYENEYFIESA